MFYSSSLPEIDVEQLAKRLAETRESLQLIDVRERAEVAIASIDGFIILPLSEFSQWSEVLHENFEPETETIVICHHGMRSAQMCQWLITQGFTNVANVIGGIDAYSQFVDATIPRY
jgi:rhodanese-related sulfurtransferase